jgi:hypothetical protein
MCCYLGRGQEAHDFAAEMLKRQRMEDSARQKIAAARQWIGSQVERIVRISVAVDDTMIADGFYRHRDQWRRRGPITMATISAAEDILRALKREKARRDLDALDPAELDAKIDKYLIDLSKVGVDELITKVSDDPVQQELQLRHLDMVAAEIAGNNPPPLIKLLARNVATLALERDLADVRFYRVLGDPRLLEITLTKELLRWRNFAHRKLNSAIRTLAYVRRVDVLEIENTIDRFRIAR